MTNIPPLDLVTFQPCFRAWWASLQPDWRHIEGIDWPLGRETPEGETWDNIRKPGRTGFMAVILLLYWWRTAATNKVSKDEYSSALEDVCFVLECMLAEEDREGPAYAILSKLASRKRAAKGALPPSIDQANKGGSKRKMGDAGPARSMRMRIV